MYYIYGTIGSREILLEVFNERSSGVTKLAEQGITKAIERYGEMASAIHRDRGYSNVRFLYESSTVNK